MICCVWGKTKRGRMPAYLYVDANGTCEALSLANDGRYSWAVFSGARTVLPGEVRAKPLWELQIGAAPISAPARQRSRPAVAQRGAIELPHIDRLQAAIYAVFAGVLAGAALCADLILGAMR